MSRGAGRVQRVVHELIDADENGAWTTGDICAAVYRGANRIEKKHRVAVSRALRTTKLPEMWAVVMLERSGCEYMLYNRLSVESTTRKRWQSSYARSVWSFDYFKEAYSHQVDKPAAEVAEYREFHDADELGRVKLQISDEQRRLGLLKMAQAGVEFVRPIIDRLAKLRDREASLEADLKVSVSADLPIGNTYAEVAR